ncbi:MAG: ABC transporter substrate-binding protein [Chloroflexota bacterium]|nr:peptide ABC transporter substrate-binding protein [Caldilinea sp.]GIK75672.1 MAG: ABC transporter substrate-binding protein [Chloroflexota bacterium]
MRRSYKVFLVVSLMAGLMLAACGAPAAPASQPAAAPEAAAPAAGPVVNRLGVTLPDDALPLDQQVFRYPATEATYMTWDASVYDENEGDVYGWADSCVRPNKDFDPQPNICESWSVSEDGLVWTFNLQQDKVWSDGTPLTANDFVFTFQRYARPDYDFEWFYSMMGIKNWAQVVSGELPPEELGVKAVDDHTLTIETDYPVPYLIRIMADAWVVPQHIVKDRLDDGTWSLKPENYVSAGPFVLESYERGRRLTFVANEKYTGPYPPMVDKVIVEFMDPQVRFAAYKNGELDAVGGGYTDDLPPSAMAEIMANPDLQKELISWPNFITYYLFFDTWNPPFDNLQVRQAFSHAIDRDRIVNGPLQYQAVAAYSMNPPGFPGENVEGLKDVQAFDPEKAKQLLADAGYPDGAGFPKLTLYTRQANPALTNAAEAIAAMLKTNLNVDVEIQNLDYGSYMDALRAQKRNQSGNFLFALVPYEFDFVDGSNMLSVWGGCENPDAPLSQMPGRHTWYNQEYNNLLCEAGQILGDEDRRNELYQQAERILIEDVALVPIYHGIFNALVKPYMKGPMFEPNSAGQVTWNRFRFSSRESQIYKSSGSR